MDGRRWLRLLPPTAIAAVIAGVLWWALNPITDLSGVEALIFAGRHDEAERQIRRYLASYPADPDGRLLLARSALSRPEPRPDLAVEALRGVVTPDPRTRARLKATEAEARFRLMDHAAAETLWREALRLDPRAAEVGWSLLNLFALQERDAEARILGLTLFQVEPDPHDRVQLLLQLIRHDAHKIAAASVVKQLEPVVAAYPGDTRSRLTLGRALVRDGRFDAGLSMLRQTLTDRPDDPEVRVAHLNALVDAARLDELTEALRVLPESVAKSPRTDAARGWLAGQRGQWSEAVSSFERAWNADPVNPVLAYRLQTALRNAGRGEDLSQLTLRLDAINAARTKLTPLYDRIDALPDLGRGPHAVDYLEAAETLGALGRSDEAAAWRRLAAEIPPPGPRSALKSTAFRER